MYLKKKYSQNESHYILCESYREDDCWKSRLLMDLGPDPERHIVYPGGNSFYVHEAIEDGLREKGASFSSDEIEEIFMPFIDPEIRRIVEMFQRPARRGKQNSSSYGDDLIKKQKNLHSFDKRRLHYLRFGRVDIGNLEARPWKFLNVLLDKSRDEIEHVLEEMERDLPPQETQDYIYTALHMQSHFRNLLMRHQPAFLDKDKLDHYLLKDLCRLNTDETFFRGVESHDPETLHPYLIKYLVLYFDFEFDPRTLWGEYVEDFMRRHRFYRAPRSRSGISMPEEEACKCLGISPQDFKKMKQEELLRFFRSLAKETHPDRGGDEEAFIKIKEAYECLSRLKGLE